MASYSNATGVSKTLTSTTADTVTIGTAGMRLKSVEVVNDSASAAILYFTVSKSATAPTTAVSAADGTYKVLPGSSLNYDFGTSWVDICTVSVVGSANAYGVYGYSA